MINLSYVALAQTGLLSLVSCARETTPETGHTRSGTQVQRLELRKRASLGLGTRTGAPGTAGLTTRDLVHFALQITVLSLW